MRTEEYHINRFCPVFLLIKYIILLMEIKRSRPPFEKIMIGPFLVLGEMTFFGHYMESLKITKQATGKSYIDIAKKFWKIDGPMSFYRGFYPYGLLQMGKGIPVVFTQGEIKYKLDYYTNFSNTQKGIISGITAGMSEAFISTPLQRLKTLAMTNIKKEGKNTTPILFELLKKEGFTGLYKGLPPMLMKRSFDWGIRFGVISKCNQIIKNNNGQDYELTPIDKIGTSFIGGAVSCLSMPFDSWIANCQKYDQKKNVNAIEVAKNMYKQDGIKPFTRGLVMRLFHSGWYTAWVVGLGGIIYDKLKK